MVKAKPKHVRTVHAGGRVDLSTWSLQAFDDLDALKGIVARAASEAIAVALEGDNTTVDFPAVWGQESDGLDGAGVADPLTVYLRIGLGAEEGHLDPRKEFSLRGVLEDAMADPDEGPYREGLANIRNALRALADEIDAALAPKPKRRKS